MLNSPRVAFDPSPYGDIHSGDAKKPPVWTDRLGSISLGFSSMTGSLGLRSIFIKLFSLLEAFFCPMALPHVSRFSRRGLPVSIAAYTAVQPLPVLVRCILGHCSDIPLLSAVACFAASPCYTERALIEKIRPSILRFSANDCG